MRMMTMMIRRITIALALAWFCGASATLMAQRPATPATMPSPTVTPSIEQRYEQPGRARRQVEELQPLDQFERRGRWEWGPPIVRIGQSFELKAEDTSHDIRGVMSDFKIDGHVIGDLVVVMGDVTLGEHAVIDRDLVVIGGNVKAAKGAKVGDDFVLVGGTLEAGNDFLPGGEHVVFGTPALGQGLRAFVPWVTRGLLLGRVIVPDLPWVWKVLAVVLFLGVLASVLFNRPVAACADTLARRPLTSFLMGLLVMMLMPIFIVILAASVIGILVIPFAITALVVAAFIGRVAVTRAVGRIVLRESDPDDRLEGLRSFAIGSVLIVLAYMTPAIGLITWMFAGSFALGSATMTAFGSWRRERPVAPPTPADPASGSGSEAQPPPVAPPPVAPPPIDVPPAAPAFSAAAPTSASALSAGDLTLFPRATLLDRLAAIALDFVLVGIAAAFFDFDRYRGPAPFFMLLFAYHIVFWGWKGTTLGGIICNVRIVRASRAPMRFIDAVVRGLTAIFSFVALGIGFFWMLSDPERQTWHDKIAGTFVVKLPRELVLE